MNRSGLSRDLVSSFTVLDGTLSLGVFDEEASALKYWNIVAGGQVIGRYEGTTKKYYHNDHLGSTRAVVTGTGSIVEVYDFDPLGLTMPGRVLEGETWEQFTGKEHDAVPKLDYFGARFYMAALGRWTSVDPLADTYAGWSPYNYVLGNPMRLIDPTGAAPDEFQFDREGNFVQRIEKPGEHYITVVDPTRGVTLQRLEFNDPQIDVQKFEEGAWNSLNLDYESSIEFKLEQSGVNGDKGFFGKYSFASKEGLGGGKMDYAFKPDASGVTAKGDQLHVIGNVAYNIMDAGNFVWGAGMQRLGFSRVMVSFGSEGNAFWNAKNQNAPLSDKRSWYDPRRITWMGDSAADQRSILNGYRWAQ